MNRLSQQDLEAARRDAEYMRQTVSRLSSNVVTQRLAQALDSLEADLRLVAQSNGAGGAASAGKGEAPQDKGGVLARAASAGVPPGSAFHRLVVAVHCLALSRDFICIGLGEDGDRGGGNSGGTVRGFAPPVRDLPEGQLLPRGWDTDAGAASLRYRREDARGKIYVLKLLQVDDIAAVHMGVVGSGNDIATTDVPLGSVPADGDWKAVEGSIKPIFEQVEKEVLSKAAKLPPPPPQQQQQQGERPQQPQQPPQSPSSLPPPHPGAGDMEEEDPLRIRSPRMPGRAAPGGDFRGDLMPGGGAFPDLYGGGGMGGGGMGGTGGTGMGGMGGGGGGLMGPNHPMFGGGPSGAGFAPQPRFDPYGPPMSGQPFGPGGVLFQPGGPGGPGGLPGQGGGRGRGHPPFGEPNPDHLRPPQDDSNPPGYMFF